MPLDRFSWCFALWLTTQNRTNSAKTKRRDKQTIWSFCEVSSRLIVKNEIYTVDSCWWVHWKKTTVKLNKIKSINRSYLNDKTSINWIYWFVLLVGNIYKCSIHETDWSETFNKSINKYSHSIWPTRILNATGAYIELLIWILMHNVYSLQLLQ